MSNEFKQRPNSISIEKELNFIKKRQNIILSVLNILNIILKKSIILFSIIIILANYICIVKVEGKSMFPTVKQDDILIVLKTKNIERLDLVAFNQNNEILLKRVVATEDELVDVYNQQIYINSKRLNEPYLIYNDFSKAEVEFPHKVKDGCYFVLGDNRMNSLDSRSNIIGDIENSKILGKVIFRIWPLKEIGFLNSKTEWLGGRF